jgi:hypothetical protein
VPVGLDARDRAAVRTALRGLEVIRTAGRVDLRGAATRAEQAAVAERLADAHRTAAAAIGADGRRDPTTALVAELRGLGGAYDELARAAQRGDRAGFARARRAVAEREARAGRELDELRALPTFRSG